MDKLIISAPIVGAEHTKETYPHLPVTPDEIAIAAEESVKAGASIIHLHVRDKAGNPTQDIAVFEEVTKKIKDRCDCIVQYSTGGAVGTDVKLRYAPLSLKPEMGTLSMGTMNFGADVFENDNHIITSISKALQENGVMAELEVFDYGMLETMEKFLKKGLIPEHFHVDFVLGVPGGMMGTARDLVMLVDRLHMIRPGQSWAVAGIGRFQLPLAMHAIAMGGHVRVGVEDNIYFRKGEMATSNAQLVARVAEIARVSDRGVATVEEARQILKLK